MLKSKQKPERQTIGDLRKAAAQAIQKSYVRRSRVLPVREVVNLLQANLKTLHHLDAVGGSINTAGNAVAPPSRSTVSV